jgi:predicted TIM-barrel fold metal-dependent hydrolase
LKIDIFPHILTQKYTQLLTSKLKPGIDLDKATNYIALQALSDLDIRFRLMDRHPDVLEVVTMSLPPLEYAFTPKDAVYAAKTGNDELAELVAKYPDRFAAAVASLPLNDINASVKEAERAVKDLGLRGIQIFTHIDGVPLDSPKFKPLWAKMAELNKPIWVHCWDSPIQGALAEGMPPLVQEWVRLPFMTMVGWDFEISLAMIRLVTGGAFADNPNIKFIVHHCGAMIPICWHRIKDRANIEHMHRFYTDTAVYGNTAALMCGYSFFGADRLLFGTDMPLGQGNNLGYGHTEQTIVSVNEMAISQSEKEKIFFKNAVELLGLNL